MQAASIESLLQSIKNGLKNVTNCDANEVIKSINSFQSDPSILDKHLSLFINLITKDFFVLNNDDTYRINVNHSKLCEIFYNFSKVCTWKKIVKFLPADVYLLPHILSELDKLSYKWQFKFFLLSWEYIIITSPFKLQNDIEIYQKAKKFKANQVLDPIVCMIHSELLFKNRTMYQDNARTCDLKTLNFLLKKIINCTNNNGSVASSCTIDILLDDIELLEYYTNYCLEFDHANNESIGIIICKTLPKLFKLQILTGNEGVIENILSWYFTNMNTHFTKFRFSLAHSFKKIIDLIHANDNDGLLLDLVEGDIIDKTLSLLDDKANLDMIDIHDLHSNLLIMAELSNFIIVHFPNLILKIIKVLSTTFFFQQKHLNKSIKGSQIKDASNFISWSLVKAKCFHEQLTASTELVVSNLFQNLLINSLFDAEILIRKSSYAALQELLGRHGSLILSNEQVVKIMELPINDLKHSYSNNLIALYKILNPNNGTSNNIHNTFFNYISDWFINYNIMGNVDIGTVMLAVSSLKILMLYLKANHNPYYIVLSNNIATLLKRQDSKGNVDAITSTRLLYLITEMNSDEHLLNFNREFLLKIFSSVINSHFTFSRDSVNSFKCLAILKYWTFNLKVKYPHFTLSKPEFDFLYTRILLVANVDSSSFDEFSTLMNEFIYLLSRSDTTIFGNQEAFDFFWLNYDKYAKLNHTIICSSLPYLPYDEFKIKFAKFVSHLNCQAKASLIANITRNENDILSNLLNDTSTGFNIIDYIVDFLDDHTVTDQGDVGRLVRFQACKLISLHFNRFEKHHDVLLSSLFNLAAQPSTGIRTVSLSTIQTYLGSSSDEEKEHELKLLQLFQIFTSNNGDIDRLSFWQSYAMNAGAQYSTNDQLGKSIDSFITWYETDLKSSDSRNAIFKELILSIPTASRIMSYKSDQEKISKLIKTVTCCLNFIERLISSRTKLGDERFNWNGVLIKLNNLMILKFGSNQVFKMRIVEFLPFLGIAYDIAVDGATENHNNDFQFINQIIEKILNVAKKTNIMTLQRACIRGLFQLYLEFDALEPFKLLEKILNENDSINNHTNTDFYIQV
ncbi:hypothetical protein KAFR_0C05150 [Kazachstania africana CBS 2517]|uniref:Tubulin-folding cofactor D ARM repeats domain-containing protein n=1 Tax=Kazachstania africana (strain ATCC 22294 / BCRC 22015 / CBS 2517 / CECT 1963 / NBRC 1671 / NRRL Y-8276) TaxID=1071382 RepID=H2AT06_KAZAF|nr:hypothetical protein KAFR_0C05150 [Kazachstania africana CBS 2517]CCF57506.1 hypothetical protein KAFR_0C05150 [Kazachstania africana CBS 2517]